MGGAYLPTMGGPYLPTMIYTLLHPPRYTPVHPPLLLVMYRCTPSRAVHSDDLLGSRRE